MPSETTRKVEHSVTVHAPAARVYELVADVARWPLVFDPTVHVEYLERTGSAERIRIWATANGTARTWVSRRDHDAVARRIDFRQEVSQPPVGGMGGTWLVQPLSPDACLVRLLHDYHAAGDDPADLDWIDLAVDRNSRAELAALKSNAEAPDRDNLLTFDDVVSVRGAARDAYDFLNEARLWKERLPHVTRVWCEEKTPGLQVLEMDTRTKDGAVHTTKSVRVCQPYQQIVYKQTVLPELMSLHTGRWLLQEEDGRPLSVTSRHIVRIDPSRIQSVLGPAADLATAQQFVRSALSGNSMATLRRAKAYAEGRGAA